MGRRADGIPATPRDTRAERTARRAGARADDKAERRTERGGYFADGVRRVTFSSLCNPTERQREFFRAVDEHRFTLYGGARGGGKSFVLRWLAIRLLLRWAADGHTGVRVGIFCETFPALRERQLSRAMAGRPEDRFPHWLGEWNVSEKEFRLFPQYGGGVVCFRNLDDPEKYRSAEFAAVLIDELTRNKVDVFNALRGSRRWPGIDHTPFVAASNPTGVGHGWVKDVFVDRSFDLDETRNLVKVNPRTGRAPYQRDDFAYVRALPTDNPHNSDEYLAELESLPDRMRKAFFEGSWDVFEGQAFEEWNSGVHVTGNSIQHLRGCHWYAGLDWGYRRGWIGLAAIDAEGNVEFVHEVYFSKVHAYDAAVAIFGDRWREFPAPLAIYYDDQMDQDGGMKNGMTIRSEFERGLRDVFGGAHGGMQRAPKMFPAVKGPGSRRTKKNLVHRYLAWREERYPKGHELAGRLVPWARPKLRFQKRCRHAIRTLPALPVDPDRPEDDVDTSAEDHAYDGICNVLMAQPPSPERDADDFDPDAHPGMDPKRKRRKAVETAMQRQLREAMERGPVDEDEPFRLPREEDYEPVEDF